MKKALILHAWFNGPSDHWYPWLKKELESKGYEVYIPELPTMNTKLPDLSKMLKFVEKSYSFDKETTVFGHSLGAVLAMRLGEKHKFKKMLLLAGWDYNDLTEEHRLFWKTQINHKKIKKNVDEVYVYSSDNDPYVTAINAEDMCKRLGGKFVLVKGAGHFSQKTGITKIPQLLKYL